MPAVVLFVVQLDESLDFVPYQTALREAVALCKHGDALDIWIDSARLASLQPKANFRKVEHLIASIYLAAARYATAHPAIGDDGELETTVLLKHVAGYDLATDEATPTYATVCGTQDQSDTVQAFSDAYTRTHSDRAKPQLQLLSVSTSTDTKVSILEDVASSTSSDAQVYDCTAVGGTFDHLHPGHKILLSMTLLLTRAHAIVGITSDALLAKKAHFDLLEPLQLRSARVDAFCRRFKRSITNIDCTPIADVYGPTAVVPDIGCLVASLETKDGSQAVNAERQRRGLATLDIVFIQVVGPDGVVGDTSTSSTTEKAVGMDSKLSSTAIREKLARQRKTPPSGNKL